VSFHQGDVLLASLVFTSQGGTKRRPVLVVYGGTDDDLLVVPVTTHPARTQFDVPITDWARSGLRLTSVARVEKLATLDKASVVRTLGKLSAPDLARVQIALRDFFRAILPPA